MAGTTLNLVYDRFLARLRSGHRARATTSSFRSRSTTALRRIRRTPLRSCKLRPARCARRPRPCASRATDATYVACALGDGPVDAVCTCIDSITGHPARVVGYELRAMLGRARRRRARSRSASSSTSASSRAARWDRHRRGFGARVPLRRSTSASPTRREIKPPASAAPCAGAASRPREMLRRERRHDRAAKAPFASSSLPGDGIGPEVCGEALRVLELGSRKAGRKLEVVGDADRRRAPSTHGDPSPASHARRLPQRRRGAARRGRRPQMGRRCRPTSGPKKACSVCAKRSACMPTCARSGPQGFARQLASASGDHRGHRHDRRARAARRSLLRQAARHRGQPRRGFNTMVYTEDEMRRIAIVGFDLARTRRKLRHLGRQGQRARNVAARGATW